MRCKIQVGLLIRLEMGKPNDQDVDKLNHTSGGIAVLAGKKIRIAVVLLSLVLVGCATSRSEIRLKSPEIASSAAGSGKAVVIRSVQDERVFEQAPRDPSTPSLGFGGAAAATEEVKARAIGRKRNTYGKALGDVLLENGQTVEGVVRENLAAALTQAGYIVKTEATAGPKALVIDVRIKQFWAWFKPGFWAITLNTNIETDLALSGSTTPVSISVNAKDSRQMATESAWMEIVSKALDAYREKAAIEAGAFPK